MERSPYSRLLGVIYIVGALFGLIISLGGLIILWTTREEVIRETTATFSLIGSGLDATGETIEVMTDALDQASTNLALIRDTLDDVAEALSDSDDLIQSTAKLIGSDMAVMVEETQTSLDSVQASARVMDDFLRFVSRIPFIGGRYAPTTPLQESVAEVRTSLEPLPESFQKIESGLTTTAANVATMRMEISQIAGKVDEIETSISSAQDVAAQYRLVLDGLSSRYDRLERRLELIYNVLYLGITLALIWILITQAGLFLHGLLLINRE